MYKKDYRKLYNLQDQFLSWWATLDIPFYLTGGTALGRFYLYHRYSEDLDFFINASENYSQYQKEIIEKGQKDFNIDRANAIYTEDFTRIFIQENNIGLKLEFINDVNFRKGTPLKYQYGLIDTPENILSNKLSALISRDEPKDIFDIIHLSLNYSFNWKEIFLDTKYKAVINEIDIEEKLYNARVEDLQTVDWVEDSFDFNQLNSFTRKIADDFILGKDNSLCKDGSHISKVRPKEEK